jgi:peroxiredoxin
MNAISEPNPYELPSDLCEPTDDGACDHLFGAAAPNIELLGTDDNLWNFKTLAQSAAIIYVYPATGVPGRDPIPGWDNIPGAPGCTVQSLGFRDFYSEITAEGFNIFGLSGQSANEQKEFVKRTNVPFVLLSDPKIELGRLLHLPFFESHSITFYKRLALVFEAGRISKVFYPVFPPNKNAEDVLTWLRASS